MTAVRPFIGLADGSGRAEQVRELKLGAWISSQRSRTATLTPERVEQLSAIGMRGRDGCRRHRADAPADVSCVPRPARRERAGRVRRPEGTGGPGRRGVLACGTDVALAPRT
jgi:hypothetical protein